jgi:hypothetical protein
MKTVSFQSFVSSQFGIFVLAIIIIICGFILYTTKPDGFGTNRFCGSLGILSGIITLFLAIFYHFIFL